MRLRLAHHVIVIERLAPRADEEGRAEQRRRAGADFGDGRDRGREGGRVQEDFLVESVGRGLEGFRRDGRRGRGGTWVGGWPLLFWWWWWVGWGDVVGVGGCAAAVSRGFLCAGEKGRLI